MEEKQTRLWYSEQVQILTNDIHCALHSIYAGSFGPAQSPYEALNHTLIVLTFQRDFAAFLDIVALAAPNERGMDASGFLDGQPSTIQKFGIKALSILISLL